LPEPSAELGQHFIRSALSASDYVDRAHKEYGEHAEVFLKLYPGDWSSRQRRLNNISSPIERLWERETWLRRSLKAVGRYFFTIFTYLDIGEYNSEAPTLGLRLGADHGAELPYVFGLLNHWSTPVPEKRPQAAVVVMDYWPNFATILDPNGAGLPRWKSLGKSGNTVMNLDQSAGMHPHPRAAQPDFLQAHSAK
jgi:carboxylesterase type B